MLETWHVPMNMWQCLARGHRGFCLAIASMISWQTLLLGMASPTLPRIFYGSALVSVLAEDT